MACHAILEATLSRVLAAGLASGALSCLASPAWAQQVTGVIIRQDFSLNYQSDVSGLAAQIETGRERTVAVKPGDTLSKIISREFGVGISNAPDAYEMLKRQIVETNALPGPNDLKAHEPIQIPDALRKALENPNPNKWLNRIPKVVIDSRISSNANLSLDELVQQPSERSNVNQAERAGADSAVRYDVVTEQEARAIAESNPSATVESFPLKITFAQAGNSTAVSPNWLTEPTKQFIRAKLASPQKQSPVLIILDDAWPDDAAYVHSRDFFKASIAQLQSFYKLPRTTLSNSVSSSQAIDWTVTPPANAHARQIRDALLPLQALGPTEGRVDTVYLPLFARDRGASEILSQLIALNQIRLGIHPPYYGEISPGIVSWANGFSSTVVTTLSQRQQNGNPETSDVAVIQAAMNFCKYFSEVSRRPCFLSMSWTTPDQWFQPNVPEGFYGLFVAAAGNIPALNIYSDPRQQFAARSKSPGDVLAVMNTDENGSPVCDSSVFGNDLTDVFGVAFPGYLGPAPTDCGTSFSAPRVAWLIAAREAVKDPPAAPADWQTALRRELLDHRTNGAGYARARFVPEEVLSR